MRTPFTRGYSPLSPFNISQSLQEAAGLACDTEGCHQHEVIDRDEPETDPRLIEFAAALRPLSLLELFRLETEQGEIRQTALKAGEAFSAFHKRCRSVCNISSSACEKTDLSRERALSIFFGVSSKKRHEIELMLGAVNRVRALLEGPSSRKSTVIDYAGGIGYFAQALAHSQLLQVVSIDYDAKLQETGIARDRKRKPAKAPLIQYIKRDILTEGNDSFGSTLEGLNTKTSTTRPLLFTGLHSCGSLSTALIREACAEGADAVLNSPCCYHKTRSADQQLSKTGQEFGISLSGKALTLAGRGLARSLEEYCTSRRVKYFRYLFHLFTLEELGADGMVPLGNSPLKLYKGEFLVYGLEQLNRLEQNSSRSRSALRSFYSSRNMREKAWDLVYRNIARGFLSRPLELLLILDRARFLEESGFDTQVFSLFDRKISPRNICIQAVRA